MLHRSAVLFKKMLHFLKMSTFFSFRGGGAALPV